MIGVPAREDAMDVIVELGAAANVCRRRGM